jgi:glyoxylase-like metal-dependent hydrolase (beta-lactamase superfamily II)
VSHQPLSYPFETYPAEGDAIEVADGIFWVSMPVPFVGLRQVNVWLLRDGDSWTMIDTAYGDDRVRDLLHAVWDKILGGRRITRLILTHFHPDHAGNMGMVAEHWGGLLPLMAQAEWFAANLAVRGVYADQSGDRAPFHRLHGLDPARITSTGHRREYAEGVRLATGFRRLQDGEHIAINGDRWLLVRGEGHSPEHLSLYCAARKILIAGDQILPSISTNVSVLQNEPEGDPLGGFLAGCARFQQIYDPDTLVLPSHRRPFYGVLQRLRELEEHHAERLSLVLRAAGAPISAGELLDQMFPRALDGGQIGFAMGEALAHLNHLVERGLLERLPVRAGIQRFLRRPDAPLSLEVGSGLPDQAPGITVVNP